MNYNPPGATLESVINAPHDKNLFLVGPVGSGKTTCMIAKSVYVSSLMPRLKSGDRRVKWAVIRATQSQLIGSVKVNFEQVFGNAAKWNLSVPMRCTVPFELKDEDTQECETMIIDYHFINADDPKDAEKLRSIEFSHAWFNECRNIDPAIYQMMLARVGRFPSQGDCEQGYTGIIMTDTQPPDPSDEFYTPLWREGDTQDTLVFTQPPAAQQDKDGRWQVNPKAENIENLPSEYYEVQIRNNPPDWIALNLGNKPVMKHAGKPVFAQYRETTHVDDLEYEPRVPLWIGADFGVRDPGVVFMQRLAAPDRWHVIHEMKLENCGAKQMAKEIRGTLNTLFPQAKRIQCFGDPAGRQRSQTDANQTVFSVLNSEGLNFRPAPTNVFQRRLDAVNRFLTQMLDGKPGLLIDRKCMVLRAGMAGEFCYKPIGGDAGASAGRFQMTPDKNSYSALCDAMGYVIVSGDAMERVARGTIQVKRPSSAWAQQRQNLNRRRAK